MTDIRAVIPCVEFADYLALTLPRMRRHFSEVLIVTAPGDTDTLSVAIENRCETFQTAAFHAGGAMFNKYAALEAGLDHFGRQGWLCLLDADVVWPEHVDGLDELEIGNLYGAKRRIMEPVERPIPPAAEWERFPLQFNSKKEICGFTQIFHAADPVLGSPPWHDVTILHAGAGDSDFQRKWPAQQRIRLPFCALHLGRKGQDWCGRTRPFLDGTVHPLAAQRREAICQIPGQDRRDSLA